MTNKANKKINLTDETMNKVTIEPKKKAREMQFVPLIRGKRTIQEMTASDFAQLAQGYRKNPDPTFTLQEYFKGETLVHPYYDYDRKYKDEPNDVAGEQETHLESFKAIVQLLHPGKDVVYAQRHGVIGDPADASRKDKYKISYRAWVQGVKIVVTDIPLHVRSVLGMTAKAVHETLDLSVYKGKEQLLGVVYGCKDIDVVKRFLVPLDKTEPLTKFLAQNIDPDGEEDKILKPEGPMEKAIQAASGKKGTRGRPKKDRGVCNEVAAAPAVTENSHGDANILQGPTYAPCFREASKFFQKKFIMQESLTKAKVEQNGVGVPCALIFPTTRKWCYIGHMLDDGKQEHASNNPYISVTSSGARFKCPDEEHKEKGKDIPPIAFDELPESLQNLFNKKIFGERVAQEKMTDAMVECRNLIQVNHPDETDLEPIQHLEGLVTKAMKTLCYKCGSLVEFSHMSNGWCSRCLNVSCGNQYPDERIPINAQRYPKLMGALQSLQVLVVNGDINVTNNFLSNEVDFYADYNNDEIKLFDDPVANNLFIGSLQGTDTMLSRFATYHFKDVFHCTDTDRWFSYEGHCWHEVSSKYFKEAMGKDSFLQPYRQVVIHFECHPLQTDEVKRKARILRKLCSQLEDGKGRDRIVTDSIMKFHEMRPQFEELLNKQNTMVFLDGVFDFDELVFRPGTPDDPTTLCVPQPFIPFDADCAHVKFLMQFMTDILPSVEVRDYTLMVLGICLTQDVSQQFFYLWTGSGGNGKGRLLTLMEECLGPFFQAVSPTMLTRKREDANQANEALMSLVKARLAVFQEAEASDIIQAGIVKAHTGADTLTTRQNYGRQIKFRPTFKSLFVCNDLPRFSEDTLALWRRVRCIHFPTSFVEDPCLPHEKKIDYNLDEKLKEASPYFIGILIEHFRRYKMRGLGVPEKVMEATNKFRESTDLLKEFVTDHLKRSEDPKSLLQWTDFKRHYETRMKQKIPYHSGRDKMITDCRKYGVNYVDTTKDGKHRKGFEGWTTC